jgi:uncharacterized protein (TIGR02118 family)
MIKVSVLYPNSEDAKFDMDYYCNTHIPFAVELLGEALRKGEVDSGIAGALPGEAPAFVAMTHMTFDSVEAFQIAFAPQAEKIMADLPNFTNIQPKIQISEIKI